MFNMAVYWLRLSKEAYNMLKSRGYLHKLSLLFTIVYSLNHILLPLFMLSKVIIALL